MSFPGRDITIPGLPGSWDGPVWVGEHTPWQEVMHLGERGWAQHDWRTSLGPASSSLSSCCPEASFYPHDWQACLQGLPAELSWWGVRTEASRPPGGRTGRKDVTSSSPQARAHRVTVKGDQSKFPQSLELLGWLEVEDTEEGGREAEGTDRKETDLKLGPK